MNKRVFFSEDYCSFFKELAANNNKDWFDQNRKRYENAVKEPFKQFVVYLIEEFTKIDSAFSELEAKDCIFRINRDIRFSVDKTPYKLFSSAVISPGGKKSRSLRGVYIEFTPEHIRVYGGVYEADRDEIHDIRSYISSNLKEFNSLVQAPSFKNLFGEIRGNKNKVLSSDFRQSAIEQPLLFNKQWYYFAEFSPDFIITADLIDVVLNCYRAALPLSTFLLSALK
jgi:uncharacterized protein (TIGR02453 family)